uniref:Carrier domain-containing protein n=1 Tax=Prymnesium polylepis TaxID=72548 RepID=A0A7S4M1P6_9EUKA
MTPKQYIAQNQRLWEESYDLLADDNASRLAFPFTRLFMELPDVEYGELDVDLTSQEVTPQGGAKSVLPVQVLMIAREAIGGSSTIDEDTSLLDAGLDSLAATELRAWLSARCGADVPAVVLFDFPSARRLASHLSDSVSNRFSVHTVPALQPAHVLEHAAAAIGGDANLDADTSLIDAGLDSLAATELRAWLSTRCGVDVPAVALFDFPSARQLASYLTPTYDAVNVDKQSTDHGWACNAITACNAIADSIAGSPDGPDLLRRLARWASRDPHHLKYVLSWLLDWQFSKPSSNRRSEIAKVFFELVLAPSGCTIESTTCTSTPQTTGVLILGFAGSSVEMLQPLREFYSRLRPSWRVVSMTAVFDAEARHEQLTQVIDQFDGIHHLVVHSMSNHGHRTWMSLSDLDHEFGHRLKALVFDCGPAPALSTEGRNEAAARTAFSALLGCGINVPRLQQVEIRHAAGQVDWAWQTDEEISKQAAKEAGVATLCLCGQSDVLFPRETAQYFTGLLQRVVPQRAVHLECLAGDHCNLLQCDPTEYEKAIATFLVESKFTS